MRFKAILAEEARKRYPLSILLMVVGVLIIPFSYLFVRFGLELTSGWWTVLGIGVGVIVGCAMIGLNPWLFSSKRFVRIFSGGSVWPPLYSRNSVRI